jgi:hypothetical protein
LSLQLRSKNSNLIGEMFLFFHHFWQLRLHIGNLFPRGLARDSCTPEYCSRRQSPSFWSGSPTFHQTSPIFLERETNKAQLWWAKNRFQLVMHAASERTYRLPSGACGKELSWHRPFDCPLCRCIQWQSRE